MNKPTTLAFAAILAFACQSAPTPAVAQEVHSYGDKITADGAISTSDMVKKTAATEAELDSVLWDKKAEEIGPEAYSVVSKLAMARHIKIVAFRPQKAIDAQGLTQLPFAISVDGSYINTMQLVKDLETKSSKLAVNASSVSAKSRSGALK